MILQGALHLMFLKRHDKDHDKKNVQTSSFNKDLTLEIIFGQNVYHIRNQHEKLIQTTCMFC